MTGKARDAKDMPDVPEIDFVGALCEIWSGINDAAYHLAYVRTYLQTAALQTEAAHIRAQEQILRDMSQVDVVICRAHLAAFFRQLDHIFEALRTATTRGQKEHPTERYFWSYEKQLNEIDQTATRQEIRAYRNKGHDIPAIIGCAREAGGKFHHHFLPSIEGHEKKESIDLNAQLQHYFEFVANAWFSFAPSDLKDKFPRDFKFPVTVPHTFVGELPPELKDIQQLEVHLVAKHAIVADYLPPCFAFSLTANKSSPIMQICKRLTESGVGGETGKACNPTDWGPSYRSRHCGPDS